MQTHSAKTTTAAGPAVTQEQLVSDLQRLGVAPGQVLLVHASLKSLGWVDGGAQAVVSALREAVGPAGHVVVPTGTEENSNTSRVHRARIAMMTREEAERYEQEEMPAFDRASTPSGMGAISEALRTTAGAFRSGHPQSSFAAVKHLTPRSRFYAESWLLVHMLRFAPEYERQFQAFVEDVERGKPSETALRDLYGKTLDAVTKDMDRYLKASQMPTELVHVADRQGPPRATISEIGQREWLAVLSDLGSALGHAPETSTARTE